MKTLKFIVLFFLVCNSTVASPLGAQEEPRATWQAARYDLTVTTGGADRALNVRSVTTARNVGQGSGRSLTLRLSTAAEVRAASVSGASTTFRSRVDERNKLLQVTIALPSAIAPNSNVSVALDYRLPIGENSGLAALSPEGTQFLPLSFWYPTPNNPNSLRGADTAPFRLTVTTASGETLLSSGRTNANTIEQTLHGQPFFLTGKWEIVEGTGGASSSSSGDARNVSAWLPTGASADERKQAEALIGIAAAARAFYAGMIGTPPDVPVKLVTVKRGAGFNDAGTILLDTAVVRRTKVDALTALLIGESIAKLWVGGQTPVSGEGAGVVREGLARHLALLFLEKQFGREAAETERARLVGIYAQIAKRDAPLTQSTPATDTYFTSVSNKGMMVWRLVERLVGREALMNRLRTLLQAEQAAGRGVTLANLRLALIELNNPSLPGLLDYMLDQPTDTDLQVGVPQLRAGEAIAALRNAGSLAVTVPVVATTERGERLNVDATLDAKQFGEARFKTPNRVVRVEVDPDKLYPQLDYTNDVAPRAPSTEEAFAEAARQLTRNEFAAAAASARAALAQSPHRDEARVLLARALLAQNQLDEAEREFRAALDERLPLATTLAWGNVGLGEIALRKNQAAEAAKRFTEAVRADAEYAATLQARAGRLKAEAAAGGVGSTIDDAARAFIATLDTAIKGGRKAEIDRLIMPGELVAFAKGVVGSQPEAWATRVLRTEAIGGDRIAVDVSVQARTLGRDQAGTAVLVLARSGTTLQLADVQLFEVR